MFNKISVRNNETLKAYLVWLRTAVWSLLSTEEQKRAKSMNVNLVEKLYLERTNQAERVFTTQDKTFPVVKIIGTPEQLALLNQDGVDYAVLSMKEFAGIFDDEVKAVEATLPFETELNPEAIPGLHEHQATVNGQPMTIATIATPDALAREAAEYNEAPPYFP